jgi:hypothetical protein
MSGYRAEVVFDSAARSARSVKTAGERAEILRGACGRLAKPPADRHVALQYRDRVSDLCEMRVERETPEDTPATTPAVQKLLEHRQIRHAVIDANGPPSG